MFKILRTIALLALVTMPTWATAENNGLLIKPMMYSIDCPAQTGPVPALSAIGPYRIITTEEGLVEMSHLPNCATVKWLAETTPPFATADVIHVRVAEDNTFTISTEMNDG